MRNIRVPDLVGPNMNDVDSFLRWCAQFSRFPYSQVSYWVDTFKKGDGTDCYGHPIQLASGRTTLTKRN